MQSQNVRILSDLRKGVKITSIDAFVNYGCTRLAARIYDIKKEYLLSGEELEVELVGTKKRYAQYSLKENIKNS